MDDIKKIEIQRPVDYMLWEELIESLNCFGVSVSDSYYIDDDGRFLIFSAHGIPAELPPTGTDFLAVTWGVGTDSLIPLYNTNETREVIYWGVVISLPPNCTHIAWHREGELYGNSNNGFAIRVPIPAVVSQNFLLLVEQESAEAQGIDVGYSLETTRSGTSGVCVVYKEDIPEISQDCLDEEISAN
jgi:hypothetical protein